MYDAVGNTQALLNPLGFRTSHQHGSRVTFAWDETGNRTLLADATGRYTWLYDALSRPRVNRQPNSKTITCSYDPVSNRATLRDPDGGRFTYAHDPASRLSGLENPWNERTTFSYDAASRRTLKKLANGTRASFSYDAADRLTALANMDSTAAYISRYDYQYDNADNRTAVLEADASRVTWSYDAANQLLAENRTGTTPYVNTFSYDPAQNRLTKNEAGSLTTYSYDAANQLQTSLDAGGTTTYTFDANGNQQIVIAPNGDRTTTTWDYENQPTKTVMPSGIINTATYNGDNLRKELQDSEGTKRFVWDGMQYLLQTDGSNTTQAVWTSEPAEFTTLISQRRDAATQYPHFDALGSTRQLTNVGETVTDTWLYDAWGNALTHTGLTTFPFWFVGMLAYHFDIDSEFHYIIRRIYEPHTARWLSIDPLGVKFDLDLYAYVSNSPSSRIDPSGLFFIPPSPDPVWGRPTPDAIARFEERQRLRTGCTSGLLADALVMGLLKCAQSRGCLRSRCPITCSSCRIRCRKGIACYIEPYFFGKPYIALCVNNFNRLGNETKKETLLEELYHAVTLCYRATPDPSFKSLLFLRAYLAPLNDKQRKCGYCLGYEMLAKICAERKRLPGKCAENTLPTCVAQAADSCKECDDYLPTSLVAFERNDAVGRALLSWIGFAHDDCNEIDKKCNG